MSSKNNILLILENNKGRYISGEELASKLNISRSAVWKGIKELRSDGCVIDAVTNKGYCLKTGCDVITAEGIKNSGYDLSMYDIQVHKIIDSTNNEAKRLAVTRDKSGTVVIAEEQTGGKGRLGRTFYSPKGSGIYMSVILKPRASAEQSILVTTAASVAVCRAIEDVTDQKCSIKWVNDIYCRNKKVCGILTEAITGFESGTIESIILGIGINFLRDDNDFPEDILGKAGALYTDDTGGVTRNRVIASVLNQLSMIDSMIDTASFMDEYRDRSIVIGKDVYLLRGEAKTNAHIEDINDSGALIVRYEDGTLGIINTGEVSIRGDFLNA